jgi:hypothetical protein
MKLHHSRLILAAGAAAKIGVTPVHPGPSGQPESVDAGIRS